MSLSEWYLHASIYSNFIRCRLESRWTHHMKWVRIFCMHVGLTERIQPWPSFWLGSWIEYPIELSFIFACADGLKSGVNMGSEFFSPNVLPLQHVWKEFGMNISYKYICNLLITRILLSKQDGRKPFLAHSNVLNENRTIKCSLCLHTQCTWIEGG